MTQAMMPALAATPRPGRAEMLRPYVPDPAGRLAPRHTAGHQPRQALLRTLRAILDDPGRLAVRSGASAGQTFAGGIGPACRRSYTVIGDAINLAARLASRAAPGQLLATRAILDRAGRVCTATALPAFRVKGKAQPVSAFDVLPGSSCAGRARRGHSASRGGVLPARGGLPSC